MKKAPNVCTTKQEKSRSLTKFRMGPPIAVLRPTGYRFWLAERASAAAGGFGPGGTIPAAKSTLSQDRMDGEILAQSGEIGWAA